MKATEDFDFDGGSIDMGMAKRIRRGGF